MEETVIRSRAASEDFSALLGLLESNAPLNVADFRLPETLARFSIRVEGPGYKAVTPGEQTRTLWEIQEYFFRLAALLVHGTTDIRKLSTDERKAFELQFRTLEGSWVDQVLTDGFWKALFENTAGKMDSKTIALLIMGALCVWGGTSAFDSYNNRAVKLKEADVALKQLEVELKGDEVKIKEAEVALKEAEVALKAAEMKLKEEETKQLLSHEETVRYQALVDAISPREKKQYDVAMQTTAHAKRKVAESLAKRSPDATRIEVGGTDYQGASLEALRARSKNQAEESEFVSGQFKIVKLNTQKTEWVVGLQELGSESVTTVTILEAALNMELAEAQETIAKAIWLKRDILATYVTGKRTTFLISIRPVEDDPTEP